MVTLMSKEGKKPALIVFDTVSTKIPNGICLNEVLIREGFAKANQKWTVHGLLPWQHPYEQVRLLDKNQVTLLSDSQPNIGSNSSGGAESKLEKRVMPSQKTMKESIDKTMEWLKSIDETIKADEE